MDITPVAGISRRNKWSKRTIKGVLVAVVVALVLRNQVNDRPKSAHVYYTSNPYDDKRDGIRYTCGCSLPTIMQDPQNPTETSNSTFESGPRSGHNSSFTNICQDRSTTVTVTVLMYPNSIQPGDPTFSQVGILDGILQDAYGRDFTTKKEIKNVRGFHGVKQAHDISWHNNVFLESLPRIYLTRIPKQKQLKVPVDYLKNSYPQLGEGPQYMVIPFLDFPTSYVNLAFAYNCTNCSKCPLQKVNQIFRNISGDFNSTWGSCDYWWNTPPKQCENGMQTWYTAKCVMYPTEALPLNYAIQSFFEELTALLSGPEYIFTPEDLAAKSGTEVLNWNEKSSASFSANVLHMEFSKVASDSIQLNFFELEKYTAAWLAILNAFPTLDTECSKLKPVEIANGTSICNVFTNAKNKELERECIKMTNKSECEERFIRKNDPAVRVTVDADANLWREFNVRERDWSNLMCMNYVNDSVPPYLVLWKTAQDVQNTSLNPFLESKIWSNDWAQNSGVCINSYINVSRQEIGGGNNTTTAFMETECRAGYCWLTGQYHQLNDIPGQGQEWHKIHVDNPPNLFVCYTFRDQNVWIWLLLVGGILFGWLGTADLVCEWIAFRFSRLIWHNIKKLLNRSDGNRVTDSASVPRGSGEVGGIVVMKHLYRESWSDTAVILGRRKPVVEFELCPPLGEAAGGLGNTTEEEPSKNS